MKTCAVCGSKFKPVRITPVCSPACAIAYNKVKEVENRFKAIKQEVTNSIPFLKRKAREVFQSWIRKRDEALPCISCGTMIAKWDGGHYLKAELYSGLIFNEINVNKQCAYCNQHLNGNQIVYRQGLILKYGEQVVVDLESIADSNRSKKFTREELKLIISKYK